MSRSIIIRDALWGDVDLDPVLVELLGTPELQRLRGIRQLGTAHLVYPSANHTRFEHVLGTCHVAGRILAALDPPLEPRLALATRAAALVHDVGHVPYGHTFEDERRIFPRHDRPERTRHFLGDTELGRALARHGLRELVLAVLDPAAGALRPASAAGPEATSVPHDIVAGTVCADLLDYLARDAYFTGIRRVYDERLFRYFAVRDGRLVLRLGKRGMPREDAYSEVIHLLRLRYTLSERVYYHHAKIAAGALVSKLVERAVAAGLQLAHLFRFGDEGLLCHLEERYGPADPVLRRLHASFRARSLPKRAYVLSRRVAPELQESLVRRFHSDRGARERCEAELERELDLEPGDVIVYCPQADMALKEADIPVEDARGRIVSLATLELPEITALQESHRDLWRFYVFLASPADRRSDLQRACEDLFGAPSELGA